MLEFLGQTNIRFFIDESLSVKKFELGWIIKIVEQYVIALIKK